MAQNDTLSQEGLRQLSNVLEEAKALADRQLEIVENTLKYEKEIGKTKIGYLNSYFSAYDKKLQQLATKQSQLGESFLVYQSQLDNFEAGRGGKSKRKKQSKKPTNNKTAGSSGGGGNHSNGGSTNDSDDFKSNPVYKTRKSENKKVDNTDAGPSTKEIEEAYKLKVQAEERLSEMRARDTLNAEERERELLKKRAEWEKQIAKERIERQKGLAKAVKDLHDSEMRLEALRHETEEDHKERIMSISVKNRQSAIDAENSAQESLLNLQAQKAYYTDPAYLDEIVSTSNKKSDAEFQQKNAEAQASALEKKRAQLELYYKRKNNGILEKEDAERIRKKLAKEDKDQERLAKNAEKREQNLAKQKARLATIESEKANAAERQELREGVGALTANGASFAERKEALYNLTHDTEGDIDVGKAMSAAMLAVSDLAKQLEGKIDEIGSHKGNIDTRLQGSNNDKYKGSYWDQLVRDMTSVGAINPYFKQEDFAKNIETLVSKGISFDLKQRAFLMTISDKIAGTFEVSNATLLRLVRIQQEDSTAGRLGMESALNAFLNNMYETSEYLSDVAGSVKSSLEEMEALMAGAEATEVEYQVQKWLGSLYSVGMSQNATQGIADALGKIAAGQIEGLTNGGAGNLLIMAANDAGLSIADILTDGINSSDTNKLLQAAVNYLAELSDSAKDNKVVQQQLADVFGVKASDLRAATNLVLPGTTTSIYSNSMTYNTMLGQLSKMAGSMGSRTSVAEMMTNFWENGQYTLAGSMASNPVSYFIYKMAKVVDDAAGGIDLPFLNVMGFGVDLNTTVSDLMRIAAVGGGILGSIGPMISGLGSSFNGQAMLNKLGIGTGSSLPIVHRGGGSSTGVGAAGGTVSESGSYAGNASGSDIKDSTIQESEDSKKQQMIEAKEEEEANQVNVLNETVLKIYELLDDVAHGGGCFNVKVEGYGLTKAGSSSSLGGIGALNSTAGVNNNKLSGKSLSSTSVSGNIDFGGWTTT